MKKFWIFVLAAVLMLTAVACKPDDRDVIVHPSVATTSPTETTVEPTEPTTMDFSILTDEQEQDISDAWYAKMGRNLGTWYGKPDESGRYGHYQVRCYGVWNDYAVLFRIPDGYIEVLYTEEIGGHTFKYNHPIDLFAYKDGEFYDLADAYELGLLSYEDIAEIAAQHRYCSGQPAEVEETKPADGT